MKFTPCTLLPGLVLLIFVGNATAQSQLSTRNKKAAEFYTEADNFRVRGQYQQALELLDQAIDKDKNFYEAYFRTGLVYKSMREYILSNQNFLKGMNLTRDSRWQKAFWFELGDNYLRVGDYSNALKYLDQYISNEISNKAKADQAKLWKACAEFSLQNMRKEIAFAPRRLSDTVNCFALQYFPVLTADEQQLIFTRRAGFSDDHDEDLVISTKDAGGNWLPPASISDNINSRFQEGTCTISADGRQLIFTACQGRRGYGSCDLFESRKVGDNWSVPVNIGPQINSPAWESQPTLSADGRTLYFVSDRRGGVGGRDIYVSFKRDENTWTRAMNLGRSVNTVYDEMSPFIHVSGRTIYFASNGRPGFGGYDIYKSDWADSAWSAPVNFGYPINNYEDQFSLFITADGARGYYSHEENTLKSSSRIFEFTVPDEYRVKYKSNVVKGVVRDSNTKEPVNARVELFNLANNEMVSVVYSDSISGNYLMVLTEGSDYALYVNAKGYLFQSMNFNYESGYNPRPVEIDIDLEKAKAGASVVLKNIFFDLDKYDLKPKSITELDKIARFLLENSELKVEISGHTDNTGSDAYNINLSQKRAQSVSDYLINKGIKKEYLTQKGYGSQRPLKPNDTEENRQVNRRIEFRILN